MVFNSYNKIECLHKRKFNKGINCLCFLRDGRLAVGFNSSEIMILGINNDTIGLRINIHSQAVTHFLATDKNELISCSFDGTIRIIEVEENRYRETRQFNYNTPLTYMITNNSKIIASSLPCPLILTFNIASDTITPNLLLSNPKAKVVNG